MNSNREEATQQVRPSEEAGNEHADQLSDGLTCIPTRIHYTATPDTIEQQNELEQIQIETFLNALAEVALAVAMRTEQVKE